ncbi:hypothetical protein CH35J_007530 [Colletotrichum higginsianum]|uniref:Secreted protein n=1 Tax=Colletotrichum higginsianum TaxID=80884 RepID=A0A4T0VYQ6_9PEZI|nr:hypothetical protein CH35J_007530 [Colletotrichum higginsianum]
MIRLFSALPFALAALCQQILIERVPEYSGLPGCAASPLAEIVGDMRSGCGDAGRGASHSCFCSASSTIFDAIISSAVASRCRREAEATSGAAQASAVFGEYCRGLSTLM